MKTRAKAISSDEDDSESDGPRRRQRKPPTQRSSSDGNGHIFQGQGLNKATLLQKDKKERDKRAAEKEKDRAKRAALLASDSDSDDSPRNSSVEHKPSSLMEKEGLADATRIAKDGSSSKSCAGGPDSPTGKTESRGTSNAPVSAGNSPVEPSKKRGQSKGRVDHESMQTRTDKELILWLNSQTFPSALLSSDVSDLRSGQVIYDCMSVFLCGNHPSALTLAPSHPGPPSVRIAVTLDALISFLDRREGVAAEEPVHETLLHLDCVKKALLSDASPDMSWTDELLMWMVTFFRHVACAGKFTIPDLGRLARAADAAAALRSLEHSQESSTAAQTSSKVTLATVGGGEGGRASDSLPQRRASTSPTATKPRCDSSPRGAVGAV